jgi:hypothetical protein
LLDQAYITQGRLSKAAPGGASKASSRLSCTLEIAGMTVKQKTALPAPAADVEQVDTFLHFL